MYHVITVEREYGCGGGEIAQQLATQLGWKLWDQSLTAEIAKLANVDYSCVLRCDERVDSAFARLAKAFWRGSYESSTPLAGTFDADDMVKLAQRVVSNAANAGNCVVVGRGAPYFLRGRADTFHVFLYAPRVEKLRRLQRIGKTEAEAEELLDTVDRDRISFVKHYFGADWPTRPLYHMMLNTVVGNENVISSIISAMENLDQKPQRVKSAY